MAVFSSDLHVFLGKHSLWFLPDPEQYPQLECFRAYKPVVTPNTVQGEGGQLESHVPHLKQSFLDVLTTTVDSY